MQKQDENFVYVRVNYCGFIPILNCNGPVKASFVSKENIKRLIRSGYDVQFLNKSAFPEFQKQMEEYRKACEANDYVGAKAIASTVLDVNPNSAVQESIKATEGVSVTGTAPVVDPVKAALDAVNGGEGSEPNASGNEGVDSNDDITSQLNDLGSSETVEGAGASVFDASAADFSETESDDEPVDEDASGEVVVEKTSSGKKGKRR